MAPGTVKLRESLQQSWRIYLALRVDIGFNPAFHVENPGQIPIPGIQGIAALVDIGAMESCIDSNCSFRSLIAEDVTSASGTRS